MPHGNASPVREIGLGAGWNKPEHDAIGIAFEPAGVRIKRLTEAITIFTGCLADGPFSFSGEHYIITGHDGAPKPAQRRTRRSSSAAAASAC